MNHNLCKNCGNTFEGNFCSNCGQKGSVGELNIHDLFHELWHAVTHTDKGILKLIKDLLFHPKKVYLGYFSGKRKTYFSPITFFLISATLLLLVGIEIYDYEDKIRLLNNPNGYDEYGRYIFLATKYNTLIILPFEIFMTWLLYRKRFNLSKNCVFWIYLNGLFFTIQLVITPIYFAFILHKDTIDFIFSVFCYIIMYWHLMLVFGQKKISDFIIVFIIINLVFIFTNLITYYNLLGDKLFEATKTNTIFELILLFYTSM